MVRPVSTQHASCSSSQVCCSGSLTRLCSHTCIADVCVQHAFDLATFIEDDVKHTYAARHERRTQLLKALLPQQLGFVAIIAPFYATSRSDGLAPTSVAAAFIIQADWLNTLSQAHRKR